LKIWTRFRAFIDDTIKEMKRVSWPSREEVQGTTLVVVIVALYLGVVDAVLGYISRLVLFGSTTS
jgi:preprotein translocase SecE subunit